MSIEVTLKTLRTALTARAPYISGTCLIPPDEFTLYYGPENDARRIDLSKGTVAQLMALSEACEPATFGVNQKDVLDESYRRAGKMDVSNFSTKFSIEHSGIIDLVRNELLDGGGQVQVELYKLNVYGKDSFFKAHKDTPRGAKMFGSLVVVFPTSHTGGALLLRHKGQDWTFDSAKELSEQANSVGYVALYNDVEHEVSLVTSGYRVTLTYNLYHADNAASKPRTIQHLVHESEAVFKAALLELLAYDTVLPEGGTIGFGLCHEYPVNKHTKLSNLCNNLKGSDALVKRVCDQLSLKPSLKFIYQDEYEGCNIMSDSFIDLSGDGQIEDLKEELREWGGVTIRPAGEEGEGLEVYWAKEVTETTSLRGMFVAYGNEASMGHYYGKVCLVVQVGQPGSRTQGANATKRKRASE